MERTIKKAAIIGSGVMGSGICALFANIGIPTLLLDIVPQELTAEEKAKGYTLQDRHVRNRLANHAKQSLAKKKPPVLTVKGNLDFIECGNLEDDIEKLKDVDWIIEAVTEKLEIKKKIFEKIDEVRKQGSIVSSNTSGISIEAMAEGRSDDFKRHFLGTHFFNPPRYMKLLELIPTKDTDETVLSFIKTFAENRLGKGVVIAKDTPNFIANRIGTYGLLITVQEMIKGGYSVGEIDSITGTLIGRPKSATFRTLDVVGLDTFIHVARNIYEKSEGKEKEIFEIPGFMEQMLAKGWLGTKAGQGFYLKKNKDIYELNIHTLEYEERKRLQAPSIEKSKLAKGLEEKLQVLVYAEDRAGAFLWKLFKETFLYSAHLVGVIADDILSIDQALKWGFGWELGPFETWDAIGLERSVEKMLKEGEQIPAWILEMLSSGRKSFYEMDESGTCTFYHQRESKVIEDHPNVIDLNRRKKQKSVIKKNSGASLIDIGDDVALLEFHSPGDAIGYDIIEMIYIACEEVERNYLGLVIGHQGKNFCVGANLMLILMEAQDENFDEIENVVRQFQTAMLALKYCKNPVVAAPFRMTLGGGAELCLHTDTIVAASETYMGLVETGVGLIPGGGGNKEFYLRQLEKRSISGIGSSTEKLSNYDLHRASQAAFETIAMAKVSTSAQEGIEYGYLRPTDHICFNNDHLLMAAKQKVLELSKNGYHPPVRKKIPVVGEAGYAAMLLGAHQLKNGGYLSEHDMKIADKLAFVIAGGRIPEGTFVDEQYLLDLEREAFLSLVGEPKTQARMQHMLLKGKPLRN
ncbi:3-hydroxyacyl-CoA dehydrogenase/enoyl-CoA hydratase family protein [Calidifontibacillus erzurumensis]|uniref:Enoyl-CoA hydratase/isomerase family protein n=1 Tax=Calidifontibacillus erzurumensis TaxID=2741433 RepID=A0A8J8GFY9_9BACI|nr:3-hydroxyacyl-CoA dehydrogenase/enoyl-CoA hydratase family protein [Calidifontibacillus erzurumensis]NSL52937.1 enoyl-CoA hydratase/isomerase family protein [Calidifontibacillus erzurumensis]